MLEFRDVQYSYMKAKIHRPTPRLRIRTSDDRRICLEACQMLIEDCQWQIRHRRLFYPWHGVHILFEAAVIMLDSCWESRDWAPTRQQARFILSITFPDCLALLAKVGERWREAALCAEHLHPVVDEVAKAFHDRIMNDSDIDLDLASREAVTTEKLRQLLFPYGPLAWNGRTSEQSPASIDARNHGLDDFGILPGFECSPWEGEWDVADLLYSTMNTDSVLS